MALAEERVIITRDADFEPLIAASGRAKPSVIHLRTRDGRPRSEATLLIRHLPSLESDLAVGALVTIDDGSLRVLRLGPPT